MEEAYETFKWRGQTRYRCSSCEFDTYSPELIEEHIRTIHKVRGQSVLFNANSQPFESPFER